jgi:hypothetical protein
MFSAIFGIILTTQWAPIPVEKPNPIAPSHSLEADTFFGRLGVSVDGELETLGPKDLQLGYIYSIPLSEKLQSTLDLEPFVIRRINIQEQGFQTDYGQGAGIAFRFHPDPEESTPSWYLRFKYLSDSSSALVAGKPQESWGASLTFEVPLDASSKAIRRTKLMDRVKVVYNFNFAVPMNLFKLNELTETEQRSLHIMIMMNYLVRLENYLELDPLIRTPDRREERIVKIKNFQDPTDLMEAIFNKLDLKITKSESSTLDTRSLDNLKLNLILREYPFALIAKGDESEIMKMTPTGVLTSDEKRNFLDADQMLSDFLDFIAEVVKRKQSAAILVPNLPW